MNIPINVAQEHCPNQTDYISKSVVYTFNKLSAYEATDTHYIFRFPYSANTFWTNYKYVCEDKVEYIPLDIGIKVKLLDGTTSSISPVLMREPDTWYDTNWVIPSMKTNDNNYIYFKVSKSDREFRISLLGFINLYPISYTYMLMSVKVDQRSYNKTHIDYLLFKKEAAYNEVDAIVIPTEINMFNDMIHEDIVCIYHNSEYPFMGV